MPSELRPTPDESQLLDELGRQITLERRADILRRLARPGAGHLVRQLARSGFARREAEVELLIEALRTIGTGEAVFALSRLADSSESDAIRATARAAVPDIGEPHDARERVFLILAVDLDDQRDAWRALTPEARRAATALLAALREELDRTKGVSGNAYLRLLARGVIELALVAGVGGSLEEAAFRSFRARTELGPREVEVVRRLTPARRKDFLRFALEGADPARARIALQALEGTDPDLELVASVDVWIERGDDDAAVAAVERAVGWGLVADRNAVVRVLRRAARARPPARARIAAALVHGLPGIAALPLQDAAGDVRRAFLERVRDPEARRRAAELLAKELGVVREADELVVLGRALFALRDGQGERRDDAVVLLRSVGEGLAQQGRLWQRMRGALVELARDGTVREGLWHAIPRLANEGASARSRIPRALELAFEAAAAEETPDALAERLANTVAAAPTEAVVSQVILLAHRRPPLADHLPAVLAEDLHALLSDASNAERLSVESELTTLTETREDQATDLHRAFIATVRPLVEEAISGSRGNERLQYQYGRLIEAFERVEGKPESPVEVHRAPGADAGSPPPRASKQRPDIGELLRVDRLAASGPASSRSSSVSQRAEMARVLAGSGDAEQLLRELFEGGSRQRAMVRLSASGREELLRAATDEGFRPPTAWIGHPALGDWLTARVIDAENGSEGMGSADQADPGIVLRSVLRQGAAAEQRLRAARRRRDEHLRRERAATAKGVAPVFEELDAMVFGYASVRRALEALGWSACAELGSIVIHADINPERHSIVGDPADRYVVRSAGVEIDGEPFVRAVLVPAGNGGGAD